MPSLGGGLADLLVAIRTPLRQLRGERKRARFLAARLVWRSGAWRWLRLPIRFEEGFRTYLQPTSLSARYWISRDHAKEDRDFLRSCLKPGDVVVDVGANIGILALTAAALVGRSGRVVAIEPNERVFSFLRENVRLNGMDHVECLRCAIGSSTTTLAMTDIRSDDFNAVVPGDPLPAVAAKLVRCRTLDDVIPPDEDVALLKIDVEGFELPVLRGATAVLSRTARVYFECYQRHCDRYGYAPRDLIDFLEDHGFSLYRWRNGTTVPLRSPGSVGRSCENLVAVRQGDGRDATLPSTPLPPS